MARGFTWADVNNFYQAWPDSEDKKPGCLPLPTGESSSRYCPSASERIKIIPQSDWADLLADPERVNLDLSVPVVLDQDGVGSCATESSTGAVLVQRSFTGQEFVLCNPWYIYRVTSNGRDGGSNIDSNLAFLREHGVAPEALHPRSKGWRAKPTDEAVEAAKRFRIDEFYDIRNTSEFVSALLQGFVVVYGRRGHSILAVYLLDSKRMRYLNSWAASWGDNGRGTDTLAGVNYGYGAYAVRTVTNDDAPAPVIPRVSELPPQFERTRRRKSK